MGQKVHPKAIRLGFFQKWDSVWFASRKVFPSLIEEDQLIRKYIRSVVGNAGLHNIRTERMGGYLKVTLHICRPGVVIGRRGQGVESMVKKLEAFTGLKGRVNIEIVEFRHPNLSAKVVCDGIAIQLEKNMHYRKVLKRSLSRVMKSGALGVKIMVSGRLGGNEIARTEWMREGSVPLQTFRACIGYAFQEANTKMGKIGVKTWICTNDEI